jgi:hypothetical protein
VLQSTGSAGDAGVVAFCTMLPVAISALASSRSSTGWGDAGSVSGRT